MDFLRSIAFKWWAILYCLLLGGGIFLAFSHWAYDDPFITYRYAENLSHGLGFVYNPGERILSTTTPLFTILLAILGLVWPDLHALAVLIGAFSLAVGGLFLWDLSRTWSVPMVGWAGLSLYPIFPLLLTTLGSETPLYLALCLGTFVFYTRQRYLPTAILAALASLARPDGLLVAAIIAGHYLFRRRSPLPWKPVAFFFGILLVWVAFAWVNFGSPLPVTLVAKQHQGALAISQRFAAGFLTIIRWYNSWPYFLEAVLAGVGIVFAIFRKRAWLLLLVWAPLYFLAYSLLGVSRYFWYYAPLAPVFIVALSLGLSAVGSWRMAIGGQPSATSDQPLSVPGRTAWLSGIPNLLSVVLVCFLVLGQARSAWQVRYLADPRYTIYRAVGEWLRVNSQPRDSVGALEVGIIGYYAQRPMVDFAGLIQPQVSNQLATGSDYEPAAIWAVEHYRPDFLVLQEELFLGLEESYVQPNCTLAQEFPGERYGYAGNLRVYTCGK